MMTVTSPPDDFKIEFEDRILDNVHGYIELTKVERKIIELPVFKRLQSIKQLSLVNWVFPGAEHTRYTHSLGVMFLADKMAVQLRFTEGDRQLIRLAGLLHDVGHYPLSHVGESSYKLKEPIKDSDFIEAHINKTLKEIDELKRPPKLDFAESKDNLYHHEAIGVRVIEHSNEIKRLIEEYCPFIKISHISNIITGTYCEAIPELSAMIQLMHSELDADRLDYLLRDASFSGTSYGSFDIGVIIKNLVCRPMYGVDIVGIKPKGISAADQFLLNRFLSLSQIVCNRHVAALEFMCEAILLHLAGNEKFGFPAREGELFRAVNQYETDGTNSFLRFTDHLFWNAVYKLAKEPSSVKHQPYILEFARFLEQHREIKTVTDTDLTFSGFDYEKLLESLQTSVAYSNLKANLSGSFDQFQKQTEAIADTSSDYLIQRLHAIKLTDNIPIDEYESHFQSVYADPDPVKYNSRLDQYKKRRLQDGLAVIEEKGGLTDIHLLTDDNRSLIKSMYKLKLTILREYNIYKAEDGDL